MAFDNHVQITGNATREPELRFTPNGVAIASFGVAVNRKWVQDGESKEDVSYVDVDCWQQLAENVAESIVKGSRVVVVGRLQQETWEDKETSAKRSKLKVVAETVAPALNWASATIHKNERTTSPGYEEPTRGSRPAPAATGPQGSTDEEPF